MRLMPIAFVTYSLAYVDRANYSFGAAGGMAHELGITAGAGSLLGALFFLGYFFFQIPAAIYAERRSAKRIVCASLVLWGVLASATGMISNIYALFIDRFLLGVMESVSLPGMLILLSHWFTKAERSRANTVLILGNPVTVLWMSIVSGYLVQVMGWRGMFIVEGAPPILWAVVFWLLVDDTPAQARGCHARTGTVWSRYWQMSSLVSRLFETTARLSAPLWLSCWRHSISPGASGCMASCSGCRRC